MEKEVEGMLACRISRRATWTTHGAAPRRRFVWILQLPRWIRSCMRWRWTWTWTWTWTMRLLMLRFSS